MFIVKVQKNLATITLQEKMTSGSQDVYVVSFEFSDEWAYLERTAVFKSGEVIINILLDDTNQCMMPWELLKNYGATISLGVFGTRDGHVILPTIWAKTDPILEGVITGVYPSDPTPDVYQQILARLSNIQDQIDNHAVGKPGATFTPSVSDAGVISWTNDGGLINPDAVNIKGPKGNTGAQGPKGDKGDQGFTGNSGVYMGASEPTDPDVNVWINPDGTANSPSGGLNEEIYSTEETRIGTWIDGKPLYRRVLRVTSPFTTVEAAVTIVPDSKSFSIVGIRGILYPASVDANPIPFMLGTTYGIIAWWKNGSIMMQCTSHYLGKPGIIVLEYTKATD